MNGIGLIVGVIGGAVIGGITNKVAIKMLFRPINPIKIGNFTLPFTPGVIPKEKDRIAKKIGEVVSVELLNEEVLKKALLNNSLIETINQGVEEIVNKVVATDESAETLLSNWIGQDKATFIRCDIEERVIELIYNKVSSMSLGDMLVDKVIEAYKEGKISLGALSMFINEGTLQGILGKFSPVIDQYVTEHGEELIRAAVEDEMQKLVTRPIKEQATNLPKYSEAIKAVVVNVYKEFIDKHITKVVKAIDISKIVEERILEYDMLELEKIILDIMNKELNAIVWFGVLLGAVIGLLAGLI